MDPSRALIVVAFAALITGCASTPGESSVMRGAPPAYLETAERYNERTEKLDRLWSRATTRFEYRDTEGRKRREQGEGTLQFLQPSKFALSVGKLGETIFWLGCDEERYWLFELHEVKRASVGLHENLGSPCNMNSGVIAHPHDVVELMGITPLPTTWPGVPDGSDVGRTTWSADGRWLIVDSPGSDGYKRYYLDPDTLEPGRCELYSYPERDLLMTATLSEYEAVDVRGVAAFRPRIATRVDVTTPDGESRLILDLGGMSDGRDRRGRLSPEAFDFETLKAAYGVRSLIILDEDCPRQALTGVSADGR